MPCPTGQSPEPVVSVFETTFYVKHELITVFNVVLQTPSATVSLFRYPSDFEEFHQKVRCHYPRSKVQLPHLITCHHSHTKKRRLAQPSSTSLKLLHLFPKRKRIKEPSNADKIEHYLTRCFQHPIISISSLLRDFTSVQRVEDQRVESTLMTSAATAVSTSSSSVSSLLEPTSPQEAIPNPKQKEPISLEHFELLKVIGKGCMGKVLLVQSDLPAPKQLYALKVISKQKVVQQNEIQHTKAERDILARLRDQPFLIKLHYAFQSPTHLYFVLDYICGGDMATQMSLCLMFSKERTQFYAAEILLGLSILHSHGIIYRDLKPENILIGRDGHIVLTDFGLAKVFKMQDQRDMGLPMTSTFCGTPEYLAPEILLGEHYSYAVDYWSLGTLIYEMLVGMTPFWADTHMEMFKRVLEDPLEFPPSETFDSVTCDFLSGLLERDAYDRLGWDSSEQIKKHGYFSNLDWDDVAQRKLTPPYIPTLHSETDLTHFDDSFVTMTPRISEAQAPSSTSEPSTTTDPFRHFAFDPQCHFAPDNQNNTNEDEDDQSETQTLHLRPSYLGKNRHPQHQRYSTSSSYLSFGAGEIIQHTDTLPSVLTTNTGRDTPSLATSVRKRHSAALSFDGLESLSSVL